MEYTTVWWSCEQAYMRPLVTTTFALNIAAWCTTGYKSYLFSGGLILGMIIYTWKVMSAGIKGISNPSGDTDEFSKHVEQFCNRGNLRPVFGLAAAILTIRCWDSG